MSARRPAHLPLSPHLLYGAANRITTASLFLATFSSTVDAHATETVAGPVRERPSMGRCAECSVARAMMVGAHLFLSGGVAQGVRQEVYGKKKWCGQQDHRSSFCPRSLFIHPSKPRKALPVSRKRPLSIGKSIFWYASRCPLLFDVNLAAVAQARSDWCGATAAASQLLPILFSGGLL